MKKYILLLSLFVLFSCEDEKEEEKGEDDEAVEEGKSKIRRRKETYIKTRLCLRVGAKLCLRVSNLVKRL